MDLFDLTGKQALVTGGAQGLGRMMAEGLLKAGASVAISSRKAEAAEAAAAEMSALGKVTAFAADLSTPEAATELAARYTAEIGKLDILVNNAGKTWGAPVESFPDKAWPGVMTINVQVPFTLVRELLPLLKASGSKFDPARIVNIGSIASAKVTGLHAYSYSASKAAILMVTRELAADLVKHHITANAILPGWFPTRMSSHLHSEGEFDAATLATIPMGRGGKPEDIAGGLIYLCSRAGAYVTGIQLPIDGGVIGCS